MHKSIEQVASVGKEVFNALVEPSQRKGICCWALDLVPLIGVLNYGYRIADENRDLNGAPARIPYLMSLLAYQSVASGLVMKQIF